MIKTYYKLTLLLTSPLAVGAPYSDRTRHDVQCDMCGKPFIPATALCGAYRTFFDVATADVLFGTVYGTGQGALRVYDATLKDENYTRTTRENARLLKGEKLIAPGGRFNMEVLEPGAQLESYIELSGKENFAEQIEKMLSSLRAGDLRIGSKTTRGFGRVDVTECKKAVFDLTEELDEWLAFDMFSAGSWEDKPLLSLESRSAADFNTITLSLSLVGGISIKEYTTEAFYTGREDKYGNPETETGPDYKHLTLKSTGESIISALSWAGAFRHGFRKYADEKTENVLFGAITEGTIKKSKIVFFESVIRGGERKKIVRNSIDRFSAATRNSGLYTEITHYGGDTELEIKTSKNHSGFENALAAVLLDLANGYLTLGGLTSVGRGAFTVNTAFVNGTDITKHIKENNLSAIAAALKG